MKIGIMGGTFDPIHVGHLIVAEEVLSALELDKVIFIPAGEPWMKADRQITDAPHRVEMVRLAIESNPFFQLSTIEIEHPGWTYTVDTLEQLSKDFDNETRLFLLIGWDGLKSMPKWKAPYRISKMATLVTFPTGWGAGTGYFGTRRIHARPFGKDHEARQALHRNQLN